MTEKYGATEAVIRHMIRDIKMQCSERGHEIGETLIAFMVKAVVLEPENDFDVDRPLRAEDVLRLIQLCRERLIDPANISLDTIKMQVYFDINYTSRTTFLREHRDVHSSNMHSLMQEILDARPRTREELEGFYRKVVAFIVVLSGLGSSTDMAVLRETTAALQSVLPQTELAAISKIPREHKLSQIRELAYIVFGIRIFNRHIGKSSTAIPDLPAILDRAFPETNERIQDQLAAAAPVAHKFTAILERHATTGALKAVDSALATQLTEALANCRQQMAYLELLKHGVDKCYEITQGHLENYRSSAEDLRKQLKSKRAVQTAHVYPKFRQLGEYWAGMQEELVFLGVLNNLIDGLTPFCKVREQQISEELLQPYLEGVTVRTDEERIAETAAEESRITADLLPSNIEVYYPEKVANFSSMETEYKGFCAYVAACGDGIPVPGNKQIGILRYRDKYYSFSTKEAAQAFCNDPARCVATVMQLARQRPVLIQLLGLHAHFSSMTPSKVGELDSRILSKPVTKCDAGIQTDVHAPLPEGTGIVKSYEWNEWEMRRKALQLANLRNKVTKSTQTVVSGYRRHVETQVYLPKSQQTQTSREKHTDIPKPAVYVAGLRGTTEHIKQPTKIDLTPTIHAHTIAEDLEPK